MGGMGRAEARSYREGGSGGGAAGLVEPNTNVDVAGEGEKNVEQGEGARGGGGGIMETKINVDVAGGKRSGDV